MKKKIRELCPKCFNTVSERTYTDKQLEKELLSNKPLKQSPLCKDCKTRKINLLIPNHIIVNLDTLKKIKDL